MRTRRRTLFWKSNPVISSVKNFMLIEDLFILMSCIPNLNQRRFLIEHIVQENSDEGYRKSPQILGRFFRERCTWSHSDIVLCSFERQIVRIGNKTLLSASFSLRPERVEAIYRRFSDLAAGERPTSQVRRQTMSSEW
jgi:hypothetical protein